jgi:hypothetical protein
MIGRRWRTWSSRQPSMPASWAPTPRSSSRGLRSPPSPPRSKREQPADRVTGARGTAGAQNQGASMSPLIPMVVEQTVHGERALRHLLAAPQRADHLPRHAGRRRDREPDHRGTAPSRVRGPRQGHLALHQLPRRLRLRRPRHLRRDAVRQTCDHDDLCRDRDLRPLRCSATTRESEHRRSRQLRRAAG